MNAAKRFDKWLRETGRSTVTAGQELGLDASAISHIRAGRRRPSRRIAGRIAVLTGIPIEAWDADDSRVKKLRRANRRR